MMNLRPYQIEAVEAIEKEWQKFQRELLVLPTGCGKTIVFCNVAKHQTSSGRVLILAHRDELIEQARDKYKMLTGDNAAKEKAETTCIGSELPVAVGSVQTLQRKSRLDKFDQDYFSTIIVDEAHHILADSYQNVVNHFPRAKVLGVTATPDRGDKKKLSEYFDGIAYEYKLKQAIDDGYLCQIMARTVPLKIDVSEVKITAGDFQVNSIAAQLGPLLPEIAEAIEKYAADRKTVVFLPLVEISQEFCDILRGDGVDAREVNGNSVDRKETLEWFDKAGPGSVLCNAMLLTEGWDCPSCDCVVVLRPTKIRSLYVQMVGRGTRLSPGKKNLLILDFLWLAGKHDLCRPAELATDNDEDKKFITAASFDGDIDLFNAERDAVTERKNKLAEELEKHRGDAEMLIDPIHWAVDHNCINEIADYHPVFRWEFKPVSEKQMAWLKKKNFNTEGMTRGSASALMTAFMNHTPATRNQRGWIYHNLGWTWEQTAELSFAEAQEIIVENKDDYAKQLGW